MKTIESYFRAKKKGMPKDEQEAKAPRTDERLILLSSVLRSSYRLNDKDLALVTDTDDYRFVVLFYS